MPMHIQHLNPKVVRVTGSRRVGEVDELVRAANRVATEFRHFG